ncbi:hypothetical protein H9L10_03635 [Phycicoccus endophyticus]|uniref:Uncharacterized protein n=1 Tax=Phycicoccus endophyticus TaxID=1690220 RepID=A0A7G9R3I6_9MICO|nr:hypothetical protein [Phycicoccus endophyticus]NHI19917.1 hypothetical protein [Phycicoccus endophyticus]QNN50161.1 hypothetical protein H9L10_03635 [Phycicoccus endophyticus]GGL27552.1 hypothetical protein GCM10012283_07170 [Phycicoccus endophyticus]
MSTLDLGLAARLIAGIRTETARHTGCHEWDAPGVAAALRATQGSPGSVLAAAALAAEDPSLRTPTEKALLRHWPKNAASEARYTAATPCPDHPEHDLAGCPACRAARQQAVADQVHLAGAELVRQALAEAAAEPTPAQRRAQAQEAS